MAAGSVIGAQIGDRIARYEENLRKHRPAQWFEAPQSTDPSITLTVDNDYGEEDVLPPSGQLKVVAKLPLAAATLSVKIAGQTYSVTTQAGGDLNASINELAKKVRAGLRKDHPQLVVETEGGKNRPKGGLLAAAKARAEYLADGFRGREHEMVSPDRQSQYEQLEDRIWVGPAAK
jgi:hypothetical protein